MNAPLGNDSFFCNGGDIFCCERREADPRLVTWNLSKVHLCFLLLETFPAKPNSSRNCYLHCGKLISLITLNFFNNIVKIHGTHIALHFLYPTNYGHSQLVKSYLNWVHTHIAAFHQYMLGASSKVSHILGNQNPGFRTNAQMGPNESC